MFYIAPFMHSEESTQVEKTEKASDFLNVSDTSMNKAPTVQVTTDAASNTSYAVALSRLSQSFSHNATLYQQANELYKDTFRPVTSSSPQESLQPHGANHTLDETLESDSDLAQLPQLEKHVQVLANAQESAIKSEQQPENNLFSAFYENLNYNAFDAYREMTQSFLSKSLNAYTADAMHSYWVNTLFPSQKASQSSFAHFPFAQSPLTNVWTALSDPFLRPLGLDSVSLRPAPTNVFEAWMRPWLSAPVAPVSHSWFSAFSPIQPSISQYPLATSLWQQYARMMWAR
jgi:hypothetical protein